MHKNLKTVLVLGNGFDLDLGLKTRYSDFAKSEHWSNLFDKNVEKSKSYSLLKYLNDRKEKDCWFDIEQSLFEYASVKTKDIFIHDLETDKREFRLICDSLGRYLDSQVETPKLINRNSIALQLIQELFHFDGLDKLIYSFNFTPVKKIMNFFDIFHVENVNYVHGDNEQKSLILGIDVKSLDEIIPEYSFLIKSNSLNYKPSNIEYDMIYAKDVFIFGHSLNMIDAVYFDDYLKFISTNKDDDKHLTIITKDIDSKVQILDNIRRLGVSVPKLYSHGHLEFILTDNIKKNEGPDKYLFESLTKRMCV